MIRTPAQDLPRELRAVLDELQARVDALPDYAARVDDHPTVWREMQRQHLRVPDLRPLFEQAPEALRW